MTSARLIHIVPASVVFLLSCMVAYLSFSEEPAEAYLFPRVVSIVFIGLAIWNLTRALMGLSRVGGGISKQECARSTTDSGQSSGGARLIGQTHGASCLPISSVAGVRWTYTTHRRARGR